MNNIHLRFQLLKLSSSTRNWRNSLVVVVVLVETMENSYCLDFRGKKNQFLQFRRK